MQSQNADADKYDTSRATWKFAMGDEYRKKTIAISIFAVVLLLLIALMGALKEGFFLPVFIMIVYWTWLNGKITKIFMQQFAERNNFEYKDEAPLSSVSGRLFERGHSKAVSNVISGAYEKHPMRLFHYRYTVGSGKHSRVYGFTVFELSFEKTEFPHILLQSVTMGKYSTPDVYGNDKDMKFPLENAFGKYFNLYATNGYEVEVFQIFTPELLGFLSRNAKNFSIEFSGNKMYVYDDKSIGRRKELNQMLTVVRDVYDSTGPLLNRLHDDFDALHPYYKDNKN